MKANNFCWILVGLICSSQIAHSRRLHIEPSGIKEKRQSGGYSSPGGYANVASGGYSAPKINDSETEPDATTTVVYDETNKDEEGTSEDYQYMTTQNPSEDEAEGGYGSGSSSNEKASGGYGSPASSPGGYGSSSASASRPAVSGGYDYTPSKMNDVEEDSNAEASTDKIMTEGEEMMTGRPLDQQQLENFNYPQQTTLEVPMARGGYSNPAFDSGANYNTFNNYGPPPPNNYGPPVRDTSNAVGGYGAAVSSSYGTPAQPISNMAPLQQQENNVATSAPAALPNATSPAAPQNYYSNTNEIVPQPTSYLPAPMMNAYRYQTMQYQPHFSGPEEVKPQVIPSIGYYLPPVQQQQQQGRALEAPEPQQNIQQQQQQQQAYGPPQPQNTYDGRNSAPAVYSPPGHAGSQTQVGQQNLAVEPRQQEQGQNQNTYAPPLQPEQGRQEASNEYGPPQPLSPAPRAPVGFQLDFEEFHDNDNVVDAELIQRVQEIIAEHERQQKELKEKLRREYAATEAAFFGNGQQQYGLPQQGFAQQQQPQSPQGQYGAPAQREVYTAPAKTPQQNTQEQAQFAQPQQDAQNQNQYGPPNQQHKTSSEYGLPQQRSQSGLYAQREQQEYPQQQRASQYGPPQQQEQEQQRQQQQYGTPQEQQNQHTEPENQYGPPQQQESGNRGPVEQYQQPAAEYGHPELKSAGQEEFNSPAGQFNSPAEQQDSQNSVYGPPAAQGREIDLNRPNSNNNQGSGQPGSRVAPKRYQPFELQKAILKDHFVDTLPGNQYSSSAPQFGNQPSTNYPSLADRDASAYGVPEKQTEENLPDYQNSHGFNHQKPQQQQQHHSQQEQLRSVPQFNQQTPLAVYGRVGFSNQGNVISMLDFPLVTSYNNVHPTPTAFIPSSHEQLQQQPQSQYPQQPHNAYNHQQSHDQSFPTSNTRAIILQQIPTTYSTNAPTANSGNPSDFSLAQYGVPASAASTSGSGPSAGQDVQSTGHPQQSTQSSPPSESYSAAEQDQPDQQQHSFSSHQSYNQQLDQFVNPTYSPVQSREDGQQRQQQIGYVFPQTSSFIPQSAYGAPESLTTLNEVPTSSPKPVYGIPLAPVLGPESFTQSSPSAPSPTAPTAGFAQHPIFDAQPQQQMYEPATFTQAQFAYQQQQPAASYGFSPFNQHQNLHSHQHQELALSSPSAPSYPQASSELEQQQASLWSSPSQTAAAELNHGQHNSNRDGHLNSITVPAQAYGLRTVPDVLNVSNNNVETNNQLYESSSPSGHQAQGGYSSRFPRRSRKVVRKNVRRSTTTTTEKTA